MKDQFAKLFDLPDGAQVLVFLDTDEDDDTPCVRMRTKVGGIMAGVTLGYKTEEEQEVGFTKCDMEAAQQFRTSMVQLMNER